MTKHKGIDIPPHQQEVIDEMLRRVNRSQNEKHFLIVPNYVISRTDGQQHFISEHQLMRLYGVERRECVVSCCPQGHREEEGLLWLEPSYEGDYSLPDVWNDPCLPYQPDDSLVQLALMRVMQPIFGVIQ
jgi:hypothetical protein